MSCELLHLAEEQSGNVFLRKLKVRKDHVVNGHAHNFDHTTIVFTGSIHIKATHPDGTVLDQDYLAPSHCLILAGVEHEITALEDSEYWCVYSHRDPQGEVIQNNPGWGEGVVDEAYR